MPVELLCVDADDTLWHDMRHFAAFEEAFGELLAPFADAGVSRARLEEVEVRNLQHYGYGAKSMTLLMLETAVELCGERIGATFVTRILAAGRELLAHPVELLPGVADTLEALAAQGRLVLVTKGDLLHEESKLAASGLGALFAGVEIVSDKRAETFTRVRPLRRRSGACGDGGRLTAIRRAARARGGDVCGVSAARDRVGARADGRAGGV